MQGVSFCMPSYEGSGKYHAMIARSVCINANTKNANGAYQLMRYLMDYEQPLMQEVTDATRLTGIPVNRSVVDGQVETAKTIGGRSIFGKDGAARVLPLADEYAEVLLNGFENISSASFNNPKLLQIIEDTMGAYFDGTTSDYDSCVKELENKLKLYANGSALYKIVPLLHDYIELEGVIMKTLKKMSFILAAAILCASAAGCTGTSQKVEIKEPEGELSVYYVTSKSPAVRQMLDSFKTDNPNIKLNVEGFFTAEEMDNRLATELTSGKGPDVMVFDTSTSMDLTKMISRQ